MSRECQNCGAHVSFDFWRVFSSNDGHLYGCTECMTMSEIVSGGTTTSGDSS